MAPGSGTRQPSAPFEEQDWIRTARTLLFVPGDRPERFVRASESGADGIIIDLEDAVAEAGKPAARLNAVGWLRSGGRAAVRVNAVGTPWHEDDVSSLSDAGATVVLVPKVESAADVHRVADAMPRGSAIVACLESALGIHQACQIAAAGPALVRLALGNADLAADLGVRADDHLALHLAGSTLVVESRAHGLARPLAGVTLSVTDVDAVARDTAHAASMGFGGRVCIHPRQVQIVTDGFAPQDDEVAWARRVVEHAGDNAVVVVDGQMVDRPVLARAREVLRRASAQEC